MLGFVPQPNLQDYEDYKVNPTDVSATKEAEAFGKISRDSARLVKERMLENF